MRFRPFYQQTFPGKPKFTEEHYPDLTGKVYIVTGGCTGIGKEVTRRLLQKNAKVWIGARSQPKIDSAIEEFKQELPDCQVDYFNIDYDDLCTVKPGVAKFLEHETNVHGIVHNAGVMKSPRGSKTKQGLELQWGVNVVGPWLLQKFLDPMIIKTASTSPGNTVRILWLSSSGHELAPSNGGISYPDVDDYNDSSQSQWVLYGQSKAGNIYEAVIWSKNHPGSGVLSLSCHPGLIQSELARHSNWVERFLMTNLGFSTVHGAYTELYAMLSPDLTASKDQGAYIIPWGRRGSIRSDIEKGAGGEQGETLYNYLEDKVKAFL